VSEAVVPIREMTSDEALHWIASQPGSLTKLSVAQLARRFGWPYSRTIKRVEAWSKSKRIRRRGRTISVARADSGHVC
jgi:hypothetical protein